MMRRSFVKTLAVGMGCAVLGHGPKLAWAAPVGSNDAVRIAIIGLNNKGLAHLKQLLELPDVRIAALCDLDPVILARAQVLAKEKHVAPFVTADAREILARDDVDAVVIATGNHWHALLTVWACQAGKDVYVEKPMAHTIWEGRKIVEAAEKYGRIVQVGTQYCSEPGLQAAGEYLRAGQLGKIQSIRAVYYAKRDAIGRRLPWYPADVNYDLFCGPAPLVPLERNQLHYDWHWMWATGNGDLGNNGVHLLGVALRLLGLTAPPPRIVSLGGRFVIDDVAETPNTLMTVYDYPDHPIIYEQRNLTARPGVSYTDQLHGLRAGVAVICEGGVVAGLIGATAYDGNGKVIKKFEGDGGATHMRNFLDVVRSRRSRELTAPASFGHLAAGLCHLGNISYRLGQPRQAAPVQRSLMSVPAAATVLDGLTQHLGVHGVELQRHPFTLGQWIEPDARVDTITRTETGADADLAEARYLVRESARPPFVIPDIV